MIKIEVTAENLFMEYKAQMADINHELMIERAKSRKLLELVEQYERAETERARQAADKRSPVLATAPAPPQPPDPDSGPSRRL